MPHVARQWLHFSLRHSPTFYTITRGRAVPLLQRDGNVFKNMYIHTCCFVWLFFRQILSSYSDLNIIGHWSDVSYATMHTEAL